MGGDKVPIRNKELSWLSFNARLLQEAADPTVPLLERVRFLGIFSSNLDEFFRVRVATLKRLAKIGKKANKLIGTDPTAVLEKIDKIVRQQQLTFEGIYAILLEELEAAGVRMLDETELSEEQARFVKAYFEETVRPTLIPIMLDQVEELPGLNDRMIYLACCLYSGSEGKRPTYALLHVPTDVLPRFVQLPTPGREKDIILLDDVIRFNLTDLFSTLSVERAEAYTIKLTRDAELELEDDMSESLIRKVSRSLERRKAATTVRFTYDAEMPETMWRYMLRKLQLARGDSDFLPGGRYHNFKDFMNFPDIGPADMRYRRQAQIPHKDLVGKRSVLAAIRDKDILLHYPYQPFDAIIDLLREASIDPAVRSIHITLYRVARHSNVVNALINAAKNGKSVTAVIELTARFDEKANIEAADLLQGEGVRVIHGVPGLKVHSKLLLITRSKKAKGKGKAGIERYASIGTGNFNEQTARLYTDHCLLTADTRLTGEVAKVFDFIENNFRSHKFKHLLVSPFTARTRITSLMNREIKAARKGEPAAITIKTNNFTDPRIVAKLYQASQEGVQVRLMIRGMFSPVVGVTGPGEGIEATGLIDRYLEHSRIFVFHNAGDPLYFLSSADLMPRNLDRRVEVATPIYDEGVRAELQQYLDIHWRDNTKARSLHGKLDNDYRAETEGRKVRAQESIYAWLRSTYNEATRDTRDSGKSTSGARKARKGTARARKAPLRVVT